MSVAVVEKQDGKTTNVSKAQNHSKFYCCEVK